MEFSRKQVFTLALSLVLGFSIVLPHAANAVGNAADLMCNGCQMDPKKPRYCPTVTCKDMTATFTTGGTCISPGVCKANSTSGPNGFGLDQVARLLGDLMGKLLQQGQQGGSGGGNTGTTYTPPSCTVSYSTESSNASSTSASLSWFSNGDATSATLSPGGSVSPNGSQSVTVSQTTIYTLSVSGPGGSNTCATTVPHLGGVDGVGDTDGDGCSDLYEEAGLCEGSGTSTTTGTQTTSTSSITGLLDTLDDDSSTTTQVATTSVFTTPITSIVQGLRGDIKVLTSGGTVIAGSRDTAGNTEVAGFYGGTTFSGQSQGIVASICRSRPWAGNLLSYVLPANFFDGLCIARGYQVGSTPAATTAQPSVTVTQTKPATTTKATTTVSTSSVSTVPPKVRIWSVPTKVSLGARASIFWSSQGVNSCLVTSPDGSFSQNTLSGGASTVALTGSTTFTISCLTPDGTPVTDFVTVNIAI